MLLVAIQYEHVYAETTTTDDVYFEGDINLLHGYLTEYYVVKETFKVYVEVVQDM